MTYWYATPKQRSNKSAIYSKASKIADIGPALAHTKSVFPDSLDEGDLIRVCKKGRYGMSLHGMYRYADGKLKKEDDFMSYMFGDEF